MACDNEGGKAKVPGWMVSFGDMMTLVLTFFILLVSLSRERQVGLVARGIGSFIVQLKTFGLEGLMSNETKLEVFNNVRVRFSLPPVEDMDQLTDADDAPRTEVLRAEEIEGLRPRREFFQPAVAVFQDSTAVLSAEARGFLDLLAPSLRPNRDQVLVLEVRSGDRRASGRALALQQAAVVADHLVDHHGVQRDRLDVRLWLETPAGTVPGTVDARLITSTASGGR